mmetsp:Transcript_34708/g.108996  ORF Transcript_34708/g.108996 Transcript_34708/m.108996 type:complete len:298 (+) Transcript_34708:269-1162(+)
MYNSPRQTGRGALGATPSRSPRSSFAPSGRSARGSSTPSARERHKSGLGITADGALRLQTRRQTRLSAGLTLADERAYREAFDLFDTDGGGTLSAPKMQKALSLFGATNVSKDEVREMIKEADVNGDGELDFHEFLLMAKKVASASLQPDNANNQAGMVSRRGTAVIQTVAQWSKVADVISTMRRKRESDEAETGLKGLVSAGRAERKREHAMIVEHFNLRRMSVEVGNKPRYTKAAIPRSNSALTKGQYWTFAFRMLKKCFKEPVLPEDPIKRWWDVYITFLVMCMAGSSAKGSAW